MTVSGVVPVFFIAFTGGLLAELAKWYELRESPDFSHYKQSVSYWAITLAMAGAGGLLAVLYGVDSDRNALMVLNIGCSAPLIIKALAATRPDVKDTTPEGQSGGYRGNQQAAVAEPTEHSVGPRDRARSVLRFLAGR